MTVGVGHRSLEAATPEEDFATVLKEADGAFLANQNFHDVEARMTRSPDLPNPSAGGPPQSPLFPSIHRPIPFPTLIRVAGLDLYEDEHLALEDDQVELIASVPPVDRQAAAALPAVVSLGLAFAPGAEIGRRRTSDPPCPQSLAEFAPKHVR
jgi:hypothetical protein